MKFSIYSDVVIFRKLVRRRLNYIDFDDLRWVDFGLFVKKQINISVQEHCVLFGFIKIYNSCYYLLKKTF